MNIGLYTLTSPLHDQNAVNAASQEFISAIETKLGVEFDFCGPDFSSYGTFAHIGQKQFFSCIIRNSFLPEPA